MAATRKLQGEIDRCLKKVTEGVETFEDIWQKVHNATNNNPKVLEKYESDLKKEIKKLQRLRDQIKSWIASGEIKDKSALLENRRLIETQMERFKVVERETKTKAYSKEGLGAAQKLDPAQRVKDEIRSWLTSSISSLQIQIDQYESEIESLLAGKKKRLDRDKQDRMDELRSKLDRHKFHVTKLETLLRLLDNDSVEAEQVRKIKDDVEYYIESSQEPDFEENEFLYDDIIGLDEVELSGTGISLGVPSSATTDSNNSNETGGSPSNSIVSGSSPVQSPTQLNCSSSTTNNNINATNNNLNCSSDLSTSVDITAADKRNKNETNASSKVKPIKPTAVRVKDLNLSAFSSLATSIAQQIYVTASVGTIENQTLTANMKAAGLLPSSTPSKNSNLISSASKISGMPSISVAQTNLTSSTTTLTSFTNSLQQHSGLNNSAVIQPSTPFAAVAKNNNSHLDNSVPLHTTSYSSLSGSSVASIIGSGVQSQQLTNLLTNSSHQTGDSTTTQHLNTSNNSISVTSTSSPNSTNVMGSITATSSANNSLSNNLADCIAASSNSNPNGITAAAVATAIAASSVTSVTNSRVSPVTGLLSPKHMNGPLLQQQQQDASTLKLIAQEAINRSNNSTNETTNIPTSVAGVGSVRVQQQSQPQQQTQQSQHFSSSSSSSLIASGVVTDTTAATSVNVSSSTVVSSSSVAVVPSVGPTTNGPVINSSDSPMTSVSTKQLLHQQQQQQQQPTSEAHILPLLGVAPLGSLPLQKEQQYQYQMMEAAYYHLPQPSDSERLGTYYHRHPVQTPPHYPQTQLPHYDVVEFFQRLTPETLFFVFYYMEGTKAQYLAAKALKKQSWRFHTKYYMWFQRHEEPKIINDDYEQGTYIYFDYEKWAQRKKEGFTFEYKYLEDKDLN